ncbi:MAG: MMPL family transporter, partial [Wenzhouxiangellaceae bacterium]
MTKRVSRLHPLEAWLTLVVRHPVLVLLAGVLLATLALVTAGRLLGVDSDTVAMLDEDLPFRQTHARFQQQFPNLDSNLLAIVEAPTPEQATVAAGRLRDQLRQQAQWIRSVTWTADSDFFVRYGLLFLSLEQLDGLSEQLAAAQPLLGRLARETHAATLFELLAQIEQHSGPVGAASDSPGNPEPPKLDRQALYGRIAETVDAAVSDPGREAGTWLSWQRLLDAPGNSAAAGPARETLLIDPVLDHQRVLAGRPVMEQMRELRHQLELDQGAVRLRLTGSVALGFEEMQSVISGARLTGLLALAMVSAIMLAGLRSVSLSLIALFNLALGLALTAGFAALVIGRVNLISVAFVVLYIGLGVNYAVHYLLRYRETAARQDNLRAVVIATGRFLARPLALSAVTTAVGFFAFVPTAFSGVAQLGLIAGFAMLITLALSYTALPAMLSLFQPRVIPSSADYSAGWRRALDWPLNHRVTVTLLALMLALASLPMLGALRFDSDPLNLRDPSSESVATIRELLADGQGGYRNIQVLTDPGSDTGAVVERLRALPAVERAVSLQSFVPGGQTDKLMVIEDLYWLLGPEIVEADWQPETLSPARLKAAALGLAGALDSGSGAGTNALQASLARLSDGLAGTDAERLSARINQALTAGLAPTLGRLGRGLQVSNPIRPDDIPDWLRAQFSGPDGTGLIQVFPAVDVREATLQQAFTDQVLSVAPDAATGGPIIQRAAAEAITTAFRQALIWAVIGITAVLLLTLRSLSETLKVLAPLALGGLLTAACMALIGIPFNFANVVALPLLLGVAVDNGIHLVSRHRAGLLTNGNVLKSATARAIVFGALITAGGFGNLAFSPHTGTASLGLILAVGLSLMVIATLVFLPALLGRRN